MKNLFFSYFFFRGAFFGCYGGYEIPNFYIEELGEKLAIPEYDW